MTMAKKTEETGEKLICQNRKAWHEFFIDEQIEAGLELKGTEVKSLRGGGGSIAEAYAQIKGGEAWVMQFHIPPYEFGNIHNVDPVRNRRLLLHRKEIDKLFQSVSRKGYTLVPLKVYFSKGRAKMLLGLARGKKAFDKREALKERETARQLDRAMRSRGRDE
jgi:SsrA-binding protein